MKTILSHAMLPFRDMLDRWRAFPIAKQGELDFACGIYCLAAIADHFGCGTYSDQEPLGRLTTPHQRAGGLARFGFDLSDLQTRAEKLGLRAGLSTPEEGDPATLRDGAVAIAFVNGHFVDPSGEWPAYASGHYVVLLEHQARAAEAQDGILVVADPHPWNPRVYAVWQETYVRVWRAELAEVDRPWLVVRGPTTQ